MGLIHAQTAPRVAQNGVLAEANHLAAACFIPIVRLRAAPALPPTP
jgi:hypothetical protein